MIKLPSVVRGMSEYNGNSDTELAPKGAAKEAFLDAEPLVDVGTLDYRHRQTC